MKNKIGAISLGLIFGAAVLGMGLIEYSIIKAFNDKSSTDVVVTQSVAVAPPTIVTTLATNTTNTTEKKIQRIDLTGAGEKQIVRLYGEVGNNADGIAKQITNLSNKSNAPIYLLIDSPGGSVLDGALILSAMEASKAPVYTVCERLCASMAFIIHQYGTRRYMVDRSVLMAHPASGGVQGTLEEMNSQLQMIIRYVYKANNYIAARVGLTPEQFHLKWVSQMWIDAEDATAQKYNDAIVNLNVNPGLNIFDLFKERQNRAVKEKFNVKW